MKEVLLINVLIISIILHFSFVKSEENILSEKDSSFNKTYITPSNNYNDKILKFNFTVPSFQKNPFVNLGDPGENNNNNSGVPIDENKTIPTKTFGHSSKTVLNTPTKINSDKKKEKQKESEEIKIKKDSQKKK